MKLSEAVVLAVRVAKMSDNSSSKPSIYLTHLTLIVTDLSKSIAFYESWCDMQLVLDRRPGNDTVWLAPRASRSEPPVFVLVLTVDKVVNPFNHLGFQVESLSQLKEIASRAGAITVSALREAPAPVGHFLQVRDPDGHVVEFTYGQPLKGI
ncbi:VOC family protein [Hyalangium rubrum]|uniref:VOC family protein n=1 Tax=Hyalangium rubrum TaxID=3103134 RepID=A0ABU5H3W2_9BACT|nr:VOC family protein [Hyalangium sp. s54d21]MDY7228152.1 VOC family protein [Hyalangium sp. s54d21]